MEAKRKKYISGLAQLNFIVPYSYTKSQAERMYEESKGVFPLILDRIDYEDCLTGMKKMPDNSVDLIIADPPFGIGFNGRQGNYNRNENLVKEGYEEILNMSYDEFSRSWITSLYRILKDTGSAYIVSGWNNLDKILNSISSSGLKTINHIIWKYQFGVYTRRKFVTSHYHILYVVKNEKKYFFNKFEFYPEDVWEIRRDYARGKEKNGTKLPIELVERMINFSSKPGDIVFDPFMGNGTTAISAKKLFRRFYGFEKNREMKDLHDKSLSEIVPGEDYVNLNDLKPMAEEIKRKYPHLKKIGKN
ncbi:DNA-methyltransferase [Cuniculiplasma sp. SKW3]|uniref:DNA-methyltransferase n=1 Tax=unclassified Cuniculiplasma TaxID=2619706 RepID=UPI003FD2C071